MKQSGRPTARVLLSSEQARVILDELHEQRRPRVWLEKQMGLPCTYVSHILGLRRKAPAAFFTDACRLLGLRIVTVREPQSEKVPA